MGNLGQSWQRWPLKGQGAQNADAVRGKDFPITEVIKQEFEEGSEVSPLATGQIQLHLYG